MGVMRNAYKILIRELKGKRSCRRPRHRWENNIRMDLKETGWEGADWICLVHDTGWWQALVNMVMNLQVP
jgi:hypothetical protein